jgi:CDP-diacylglycerol--glycerol-3-phosphate 3-phosphatidyltransferase
MKINLPNRLTLIRIALIPVFVVLMYFEAIWAQVCAAAVFSIACVTDYLDGDIARKRNLVTNFGKFADPIADKLLVMSAYVVLVGQSRMPAWVCIAFLAREFTVSGFRLVAAGGGKIMAAGKLGKIKTFTQMIAVILLILFAPASAAIDSFGVIAANVMMYVALVMTIWSGADYIVRNRQFIEDM